jgi:hypothetical protein
MQQIPGGGTRCIFYRVISRHKISCEICGDCILPAYSLVLLPPYVSWNSVPLHPAHLLVCSQISFTSSIKFLTQEASFDYSLNKILAM